MCYYFIKNNEISYMPCPELLELLAPYERILTDRRTHDVQIQLNNQYELKVRFQTRQLEALLEQLPRVFTEAADLETAKIACCALIAQTQETYDNTVLGFLSAPPDEDNLTASTNPANACCLALDRKSVV